MSTGEVLTFRQVNAVESAASGYATCQSSDWCDRVTSLYAYGRFT